MQPEDFKDIRNQLNLSQRGTAKLLGMGRHGYRTIQRWEDPEFQQDIPWWAEWTLQSLWAGEPIDDLPESIPDHMLNVVNIMLTGTLPNLDPFKRKRPPV